MKKETKIYATLIAIVIVIIAVILGIRNSNNSEFDQATMKCISEKAVLIASATCSHCATQKSVLGKDLDKFIVLSVDTDPSLWDKYSLIGVPTWIINEQTYPGVKSIKELKDLTNC